MILLSIVTITRNNSVGLIRTLEASRPLLSRHDVEIVVVDGNSADGTVAAIAAWCVSNPEARCIIKSERDNGIYDAMNKGLALATGRHIIFMNSGDIFAPEFRIDPTTLEANTVYYGAARFTDGGTSDFNKHYIIDNWWAFLNHNCFCHQAVIYPTDLLRSLGGYNLNYQVSADFDLTLRCFINAKFTPLRTEVAVCELGGVSHQRGLSSYQDRIISLFQHRKMGAFILIAYSPIFFAKHTIVRLLEGTSILQAYRRLKSLVRQ